MSGQTASLLGAELEELLEIEDELLDDLSSLSPPQALSIKTLPIRAITNALRLSKRGNRTIFMQPFPEVFNLVGDSVCQGARCQSKHFERYVAGFCTAGFVVKTVP